MKYSIFIILFAIKIVSRLLWVCTRACVCFTHLPLTALDYLPSFGHTYILTLFSAQRPLPPVPISLLFQIQSLTT